MITFYIPERYDVGGVNIAELIYTTLNREFMIRTKGRIVMLDTVLTLEEKTLLKNAFVNSIQQVKSIDEV